MRKRGSEKVAGPAYCLPRQIRPLKKPRTFKEGDSIWVTFRAGFLGQSSCVKSALEADDIEVGISSACLFGLQKRLNSAVSSIGLELNSAYSQGLDCPVLPFLLILQVCKFRSQLTEEPDPVHQWPRSACQLRWRHQGFALWFVAWTGRYQLLNHQLPASCRWLWHLPG